VSPAGLPFGSNSICHMLGKVTVWPGGVALFGSNSMCLQKGGASCVAGCHSLFSPQCKVGPLQVNLTNWSTTG
jgi:hypothetical protein